MRLGLLNSDPSILMRVGDTCSHSPIWPPEGARTGLSGRSVRSRSSRQVAVIKDKLGMSRVQWGGASAEKEIPRPERLWQPALGTSLVLREASAEPEIYISLFCAGASLVQTRTL